MELNSTVQVEIHTWNHYCVQEPVAKTGHNINSLRKNLLLLLNGHSASLTPSDLVLYLKINASTFIREASFFQ